MAVKKQKQKRTNSKKHYYKPPKADRGKKFTRMPKTYTKFNFKHEIPAYSYMLYPLRTNTVESYIKDGEIVVGRYKIKNPTILKQFEVALHLSIVDDIIFEGAIMVTGDTRGAILRALKSDEPNPSLTFVCNDAIKERRYEEEYYKRMSHVPEILPHFKKEDLVTIGPSRRNMIWVYEQELESITRDEELSVKGIILRPDRKGYLMKREMKPSREVFFKIEFEKEE